MIGGVSPFPPLGLSAIAFTFAIPGELISDKACLVNVPKSIFVDEVPPTLLHASPAILVLPVSVNSGTITILLMMIFLSLPELFNLSLSNFAANDVYVAFPSSSRYTFVEPVVSNHTSLNLGKY